MFSFHSIHFHSYPTLKEHSVTVTIVTIYIMAKNVYISMPNYDTIIQRDMNLEVYKLVEGEHNN